jgi:signal transduction histidine kinase
MRTIEVDMKYLLKTIFLIYIMLFFIASDSVSYIEVLLMVLICGANIYKEKFCDAVHWTIFSFILICAGIWFNQYFVIFLCVSTFDLMYQRVYLLVLPVLILGIFLSIQLSYPWLILLMAICTIHAFTLDKALQNKGAYQLRLDEERRLRYDLENAKNKLLHASKEIAHLTEVSERNRIARDIHDNAGHSIAGVLFQLQAAEKLLLKDQKKAEEIIKKSIRSLGEALSLLRETVY